METRYATSPEELPLLDTAGLRRRFLLEDVFRPGEVTATYSHQDRVVIVGVQPGPEGLDLPTFPELRSEFFLQRREAGVVNVGASGTIVADGVTHELAHGGCLYLGRGTREVRFVSGDEGDARFYLFSAPAHADHPTTAVAPGEGNRRELGDQSTSNRRTLNQYIHENGVRSCQVVMGVTTLHDGSMWNTLPAHTHDRRMEAYLYFDLPEDARVVHLMGERQETRHLVMANEQAVISPSWSIHSGVGTRAYSFVWAMAGENQAFDDMDPADITDLH
ncbi:5-dehydro-4-deoxy-D-glucuronate isomerase [Cellulomonas aerilata]|uniref:4-deoxy-L-threo-5-hexosulose-uronate ketol-isomerase n=1 Tax=Cellulomonas aerilata TaxID=515326 RepID=A0A512DF90_9CELL|nr:5-dehydro-4-deoxy-D-glucuronate isomerase [Cellulomonas aerilata]GEO35106.1 4-deoxy-L-threo-5-hexosulose-uronate ketol-isomerase [Cellulomonas aerilata]